MDEEYGFIREKLDIKLLILYILRRLSGGVDISTIFEICRVDGGVGYFDYSDCLSELTETGLIAYDEDNGRYMITPKGADDIDQVGSSLPFSAPMAPFITIHTSATSTVAWLSAITISVRPVL